VVERTDLGLASNDMQWGDLAGQFRVEAIPVAVSRRGAMEGKLTVVTLTKRRRAVSKGTKRDFRRERKGASDETDDPKRAQNRRKCLDSGEEKGTTQNKGMDDRRKSSLPKPHCPCRGAFELSAHQRCRNAWRPQLSGKAVLRGGCLRIGRGKAERKPGSAAQSPGWATGGEEKSETLTLEPGCRVFPTGD